MRLKSITAGGPSGSSPITQVHARSRTTMHAASRESSGATKLGSYSVPVGESLRILELPYRRVVVGARSNERSREMSILKPVRVLGALAILTSVPLSAANAQTQAPEPATPPA